MALLSRVFSLITGTGNTAQTPEQKKSIGTTGALTRGELRDISFVGIATPGTNKTSRAVDIGATSRLSQVGRFSDIPSSGGFTVLGRNALGQDVARDNTTGTVRPVSAFGPISPAARTIGKRPSPSVLARRGDARRTQREKVGSRRPSTNTSKSSKSAIIGQETILGSQSILG